MAKPSGVQPVRGNQVPYPLDWPGITEGYTSVCTCTWAFHQGVYQVKRVHMACHENQHVRVAAARQRLRSIGP